MPEACPTHPGSILLTEHMQPLGLTSNHLAEKLDVPVPHIDDLVLGKERFSADTAIRLGIFFSLPAQYWLDLQTNYDQAQSPEQEELQADKAA